jgi:SAM-dependent methyltransferase
MPDDRRSASSAQAGAQRFERPQISEHGRIWNYHLRGKDYFPVDRQAAEAVEAMSLKIGVPLAADTAVEGRHLLQRMVDYMLGQGIRQFLDLGSGLPSMANTHQIAHRVAPEARVAYIDIDPLVSSHASALMAGSNVVTLRADLREPEQVLSNPRVRDTLDFGHCLWGAADPAENGDSDADHRERLPAAEPVERELRRVVRVGGTGDQSVPGVHDRVADASRHPVRHARG